MAKRQMSKVDRQRQMVINLLFGLSEERLERLLWLFVSGLIVSDNPQNFAPEQTDMATGKSRMLN